MIKCVRIREPSKEGTQYGGDTEHQGSGQIIPKKSPTWGLREPKGDMSLSKACETWSSPTAGTMRAPALFIQHVACLWAPPLPQPERQGRKQLASALPLFNQPVLVHTSTYSLWPSTL